MLGKLEDGNVVRNTTNVLSVVIGIPQDACNVLLASLDSNANNTVVGAALYMLGFDLVRRYIEDLPSQIDNFMLKGFEGLLFISCRRIRILRRPVQITSQAAWWQGHVYGIAR
jgi:hypothetical protein